MAVHIKGGGEPESWSPPGAWTGVESQNEWEQPQQLALLLGLALCSLRSTAYQREGQRWLVGGPIRRAVIFLFDERDRSRPPIVPSE